MTSFTRTFSGQVISPTQVSYATYTSSTSLVLSWPFEIPPSDTVLAWQNDVVATAASLTVTLPDATLVSVGASALINNTGANAFTVLSGDGTTVAVIASGQQWYIYLVDNSSAGGTWRAIQFGTGTSSASAASLAGAGLVAVVTRLNQNLIINSQVGNYAPGVGDLATVLQSTGGSVTYSPTSAVTLGNGWFVYVINDGSGTLTWAPTAQTIDSASTKVLQPTESCIIFSDGANFWSLGYGRSITSTVTAVSVDLTGTGTTTLTANQVAAQVQDFSGTLSGDRIVEYGTGAGYWFVRNNTTGAHTVTFRVNSGDAGVLVTQGNFSILRSNGTNMSIAFSAATGTVTSVATTSNLTGGPITSTGTLDLADTAVTPAAYGDATHVAQFTVDQKGRLTAAAAVAITYPSTTTATVQVFSSGSGTYTPTAGTQWIWVRMVAGGGGSGGTGQSSPSNGGVGGTTTFNSISVTGGTGGGAGGGSAGSGGAGGTGGAGSATLRIAGGTGGTGSALNVAFSSGGSGGDSRLGAGTYGTLVGGDLAGLAGGASGGGACGGVSAVNTAGSGGGGGGEYAEIVAASPGAVAYSVGAGGAAGTGSGTGAVNGAVGGAGKIIIFEYH